MFSGKSVFTKINEKLNEGWKLTNMNCPICNTTVIGNLQTKEFICVKCDMPVKLELEEKEDEPTFEVIDSKKETPEKEMGNFKPEEYENFLFSKEREEKRKKDQENSKKMGELLLGGWAMLAEGCPNCLQPFMKSKKGEIVCVGCGPVVQKNETPKEIEKPQENKIAPHLEKAKAPEQKPPVVQENLHKIEKAPVREEVKRASPEKTAKKPSESFERIENSEHLTNPRKSSNELFELLQFDQSVNFYTKFTQILNKELEQVRREGVDNNFERLENLLSLQKTVDANKINILNQFRGSQK